MLTMKQLGENEGENRGCVCVCVNKETLRPALTMYVYDARGKRLRYLEYVC